MKKTLVVLLIVVFSLPLLAGYRGQEAAESLSVPVDTEPLPETEAEHLPEG